MSRTTGEADASRLRILRFLAQGPVEVDAARGDARVSLWSRKLGTIVVDEVALTRLTRDGLVARSGGEAFLSPTGAAAYGRLRTGDLPGGARPTETATTTVDLPAGPTDVAINLAESPIAQLARRKMRDGRPFLLEAEFRAGERLRMDYTRGMLMPKVSANWGVAVSRGKRGQRPTGGVELTDAALEARRRVNAAIEAVGPELAGVLVDVCCFLKGFETVEMERCWPVRSAKIVLKTALAALARHYAPSNPGRTHGTIVQWGAEGYRPEIRPRMSG